MDASAETSGGATSADLDIERVPSASSQSRSITSSSKRSSSKRSSATVKAALAKLRLEQAEERFNSVFLKRFYSIAPISLSTRRFRPHA